MNNNYNNNNNNNNNNNTNNNNNRRMNVEMKKKFHVFRETHSQTLMIL